MIQVLSKLLLAVCSLLTMWLPGAAQDFTRELKINEGGSIEVVNRSGRIAVKADAQVSDKPIVSKLTAVSPTGLAETDLKIVSGSERVTIIVNATEIQKRIDLVVTVPEGISLKVETGAGAIEVVGYFTSVEAKTDTGTIITDLPKDDLKYSFFWTESRPRYLADFDIAKVEEKSAGRFQIKGRHKEEENKQKVEREIAPGELRGPEPKALTTKNQKPKTIDLKFTTARGIILLNVPLTEVMSDLRERPLTEAAKAIIRSGDSLLTEAIRRASPKYFGDYSRTLPPLKSVPTFATKAAGRDIPVAALKTASVRVTDLANRSIDGLEVNDFEVIENGTAREIVSVGRSTAPFNLVLLLDVSGSVENYVNFIRKAARNFVNTVGERDRVSIVIFNEDVKKLSGFTTDKDKLSESLDTFDAGGGTAYYDALAYSIADTLRPLKGERTAIVILTDGDDNRSFLAFDSLAGSIQESGALIYPLYVPSALIAMAAQSSNADIDPMRKKYMSLTAKSEGEGEKLAKLSGGVYYSITEIGQIQKAYEDIVVQMRSAYDITFRSDSAAGASPKLKIRSKRENTFANVTSVVATNNK